MRSISSSDSTRAVLQSVWISGEMEAKEPFFGKKVSALQLSELLSSPKLENLTADGGDVVVINTRVGH